MIQRLYIKDFAIIDEIDINFKPGLTVITGETGSGKSILLQALSVSLGAKADKIMVRNGSQRAVIETEFKDREIRRLISDQGRTKAYQNDEHITLANLIKMNETRVDFHGQHDQQLILDSSRHIDYLDRYCGHEREVNSLEDTYRELNDLRSKLDRLHQSAEETRDRLDLLKFQATEIDAVDPKIGEDFKFDQLYKKLSHIEEILRTLQKAHSKLSTEDHSLLDQLSNTVQALASLEKYDLELTKITDLLKSSIIQLQEAGSEITSQLSESEFEPDELSIIEDRLNALETLKRKYGGSIESVLERRKLIQEELQTLKNPEQSEKALIEIIKEKEKMFSM
ncbi:MAG: AAA family ATPase, partial [Candidatus Neomarinimicrobiota bacterium]|nr:AAA family ATPase [Candidatus Neomarinimicrobiota bacterium]